VELDSVTYVGPPLDDEDVMPRLPGDLAGLLRQINGFIQFHGGLHIRGACRGPAWHSLRDAWDGESAIRRLYPDVDPQDVPFGEDCLGDQFLLRAGEVWRLSAETGGMESLGIDLHGFFESVAADPVGFLELGPLLRFQQEGGNLEPGQLLGAYPPFCTEEAAHGVSLTSISTDERRRFLAHLAANLRDVPDGDKIQFRFEHSEINQGHPSSERLPEGVERVNHS
jgi:hypothetical protein